MAEDVWLSPPADLVLSTNEVHVWRACLHVPRSILHSLRRTLTTEELVKAASFRFRKNHEQYIVARGILRTILGRYLCAEAGRLRFSYNPYGKPFLLDTLGHEKLCFNLSHSGGMVLYAVTRDREVGIDLEHLGQQLNYELVARQFFSPLESSALGALPAHLKREAFFACWTRKEAYTKASGAGLSIPLDGFSVSVAPNARAAFVGEGQNSPEISRWSLRDLKPGRGYAATLAVEGTGWHLNCWQYSNPSVTDRLAPRVSC